MTLNTVLDLLNGRVRRNGSAPLLTYYDTATGERTEFSALTYANWVNKTANLLATLDAGEDATVAAPLSVGHPGHWVSLIWPLAAWLAGARYAAVDVAAAVTADLVVIGPEDPRPIGPAVTLACSLHPLALGLHDLPEGVLDYTSEALAQPDAIWLSVPPVQGPAWIDPERSLTHAQILATPPVAERILLRPTTPWATLRDAVVAPLLGGGSAVVVTGAASDQAVSRIAAGERARVMMAG